VHDRTVLIGDDGGVCPTIDDALIELVDCRALDGCDAVVNGPASEQQIPELARRVGQLGLHVNLSTGTPVAELPAPSLTENRRFLNPAEWVSDDISVDSALISLAARAHLWDHAEIKTEVSSQVARFVALAGRRPARVSVHHDLDVVPQVAAAVEAAVGLKARASLLATGAFASYDYDFASPDTSPHEWCLHIQEMIRQRSLRPGLHLVACHPATSAAGYGDFTSYTVGRVIEYQGLLEFARGRPSEDRTS